MILMHDSQFSLIKSIEGSDSIMKDSPLINRRWISLLLKI